MAELNALLHPQQGPGLWSTNVVQDPTSGEWSHNIHMDRGRLVQARPIIADGATNVWSALDNVASAIAKANGHGRLYHLKFPWSFADEDFQKALAKFESELGTTMLEAIANARRKHPVEIHHIEAAREIANSAKHWELLPTLGSARAVAVDVPGEGQRIFQIPGDAFANADSFEFHRATERLPNLAFEVVLGLKIEGISDGLPAAPDSILECSLRFVTTVIESVEAAA